MRKLITIVGMTYKFGSSVIEIGDVVDLKADPNNEHDREAIAVYYQGKHIGFVANSTRTVIRGCNSAGNLINYTHNDLSAEVILKMADIAIAELV